MNLSKLITTIVSVLIFSFNTSAQVAFEKGYYLNSKNDTIFCLIKNVDWNDSPLEIHVKKGGTVKTVSINQLNEFEIYKKTKYIKATTKVDESSQHIDKLTNFRNPKFEEKTILIKELVSNLLYKYSKNNVTYFYYRNDKIEPLVFKEYKFNTSYIKENNLYQSQIQNKFQSKNIKEKDVTDLEYNEKALIKVFLKFSELDIQITKTKEAKKEKAFKLYIRPGLSNASYLFQRIKPINSASDYLDFGSALIFRIGIEAEIAFQFKHQKWRMIVEPFFSNFESSVEKNKLNYTVKYTALSVPFGLRYYSYIKKKHSIYYNLGAILDVPINSYLDRDVELGTYDMSYSIGYFVGFGYQYNKKIGLEVRYSDKGTLLPSYTNFNDKFHSFDLIFSYKLF